MTIRDDTGSVNDDLDQTDGLLEVSMWKDEDKGFNSNERGFETANHQLEKQEYRDMKLVSKMATKTANMPMSETETYQPLKQEAGLKQMEKGGYVKEVGMKKKPPNWSCLQHIDNTSKVGNDCASNNEGNTMTETIESINQNQNMFGDGKVSQ